MRRWRLIGASLAIGAIQLAVGAVSESVAHADGGLDVASVYTYTVDPAANVVRVVAEMTFTNTVPNHTEGNVVNRTYYDGFSIPLPVEAINPLATDGGTSLTLQPEFIEGTAAYYRLNVDFAQRLFYKQAANVTVTYDIIGQLPRAPAPTRVNAAYAAFNAYGIGDPGHLTVRVVVPAGYEIDTLGAAAVKTAENGNTVYTASNIDVPQDFNLFISARNDTALTERDVTLAGDEFHVRAWPGDTDWDAFIEHQIADGVPALETLIGQSWPVDGAIEVREAFTPYLYGYAGWFDPQSRELEIGEDLDPHTIVHELSHAWFNRGWFDERWISEGLAQEYSALVNEQSGQPAVDAEAVDQAAAGALQLNDWMNPNLDQTADATEDYGYNASWSVISSIVDQIGTDGMQKVFAAAHDNTLPYVGDGAAEPSTGPHDWRRFLDLVEQGGPHRGKNASVEDIFATYVLTPEQAALLPPRAEALTAYQQLESSGGDWAPPRVVRTTVSNWEFDQAEQLIDESTTVLAARDDLNALLDTIDVPLATAAEAAYENTTTDLSAATELIADETDATNDVIAAVKAQDAGRGFLSSVGMYGKDLEPTLEQAKVALGDGDFDLARAKAAEVTKTLAESQDVGRERVLWAGGALAALVAIVVLVFLLLRRRRKRRLEEPAASADEPDHTAADVPDAVDTL